jgi:putative heme-binding domain-containing protein
MRLSSIVAILFALAAPTRAQHIAATDALSPSDERKAFTVPKGFEVQLVAAEPDIGKPIQIAFDARGRLWVTTSRHYPFAAKDGETPSDKLYVLSNFGDDGLARTVECFYDKLNIPIGVLPLPDCRSCIVSNVGRILKLTDNDGDGRADKEEVLLDGFGTDDTHGMMNSYVLMPDGWVYACHGFRNMSIVRAKDGSEVHMQSGNTFRFRPDGSRIEPWTFGQVNPFGMTVDAYFNLYTADCHSKPITQLIRGATYQSFAKPHDGLGFAPHVAGHSHGSTALCGLASYEADHYPRSYRGCMFLGNVVTNRVNADRITWKGSTPVAEERPDFMTSRDPWFRPTDVKLGLDGALYVADFYNRIIGHYEVDLTHPLRDKNRGRVWRVVWKGTKTASSPPRSPIDDMTTATADKVDALLNHANITVRLLATNELIRRGKPSVPACFSTATYSAHRLWIYRNPEELLLPLPALDPMQAVHAQRVLTDQREKKEPQAGKPLPFETSQLKGQLARAAIDDMISQVSARNIPVLIELIRKCPVEDSHLRHAARVALRNTLRDGGKWPEVADAEDAKVLDDVALGVPTFESASYLFGRCRKGTLDPRFCQHIGEHGNADQAKALVRRIDADSDLSRGLDNLQSLVAGLRTRNAKLLKAELPVAVRLAHAGLKSEDAGVLQRAIDLAAGLKSAEFFDPLAAVAANDKLPEPQRSSALTWLLTIDFAKGAPILINVLNDASASAALREKAAVALGAIKKTETREALVTALQTAPGALATVIAGALANSPAGADALLDAIQRGKASPRLLQERSVTVKLLAIEQGALKPRIDELTVGLPSADEKLAGLMKERIAGFAKATPTVELGKKVFMERCAGCHQLNGTGQKIAPQLDGIGNRGLSRLIEDVLDPNRNIDAALRATTIVTSDGRSFIGQLLREEGEVIVLADNTGKEVRIAAKDIDERAVSAISIMPANFDAVIADADFYNLMAYLLVQRVKPGK